MYQENEEDYRSYGGNNSQKRGRSSPLLLSEELELHDRQFKMCCINRLSQLLCCFVFGAIFVAMMSALGYKFARPSELKVNWPTIEDFIEEDPFNATSADEAVGWPSDGYGLELEVLNALDSKWYPYLEMAVYDWNTGWPAVLSLTTSTTSADSSCEPVDGILKVCNGNYGDTKWRGINMALIENDYIVSSVAKMNEYYLGYATSARMQYTMCHEIGHGFGLSHTDESFWNRDLGNCMDYTNNPGANMHPDTSNFEFLAEMYGELPYATNYSDSDSSAAAQTIDDVDGDGESRWEIPEWLVSTWKYVEEEVKSGINYYGGNRRDDGGDGGGSGGGGGSDGNWRLLRSTPYSELHHYEIGDGYAIRVQVLLETEDLYDEEIHG